MKPFPMLAVATLTVVMLSSGCMLPKTVVKNIDSDWTSALDQDLRTAVIAHQKELNDAGWKVQIKWAGVRGNTYTIERGPTGEPLRKSVPALYGFAYPARGKCFLSPEADSNAYVVRLAREHVGGGRYGEPRIIGLMAINGDGDPTGSEVVCDAMNRAKGGVHVDADEEGRSSRRSGGDGS